MEVTPGLLGYIQEPLETAAAAVMEKQACFKHHPWLTAANFHICTTERHFIQSVRLPGKLMALPLHLTALLMNYDYAHFPKSVVV